jgi:hypothetical protein
MIIGRKTLIIKEVEEEQITETESEDGDEVEKAAQRLKKLLTVREGDDEDENDDDE